VLSLSTNYTLWLPMVLMLGAMLSTMVCSLVFESALKANSTDRVIRSYLGTIRGTTFSIFVVSLIAPVVLVVLFAVSVAPLGPLVFSILVASFGLWSTRKINPSDGVLTTVGKFIRNHPRLTIGLAAVLTLLVPFAAASRVLINLYNNYGFGWDSYIWFVIALTGVTALTLLVVTMVIDSNNVSPFKFYRDRLSAAYLKTSKVGGTTDGWSVTIRDDEDMPLKSLGDTFEKDEPKAPYQLITACLNLATLKSLLRADTKSTHFLFSKKFIGSLETGYMATPDNVTVAEAMAISGAAASSIAGYHSSFGQRFFATVFNVRLGQWISNPATHQRSSILGKMRPIWAAYLMREILGLTSHKGSMINLSDGGHTGDNLGLLPLLKRRLDVIVVVDAECDPDYTFSSLNNAIRLANIEDNTSVDIDLSEISALHGDDQLKHSTNSVVMGTIHYSSSYGVESKTGTLIYCKSSVSKSSTIASIPAHVENYNRKHKQFPHQSTGDQFFDPEQFEAYRALGSHVGEQASRLL
jgi:hypothetical protein